MRYLQIISAVSVLLLAGATAAGAADRPFQSPVIQNGQDAIAVAHALEVARNRTEPMAPIKDEAFWQDNFAATYANGIWEVKSKSRYSDKIPGIDILIAAQDGRIMGLAYCLGTVCHNPRPSLSVPVGHWSGDK